ncbi:hypothetical protein BaRGS_00017358, partial [Batillaria attramentaria]
AFEESNREASLRMVECHGDTNPDNIKVIFGTGFVNSLTSELKQVRERLY